MTRAWVADPLPGTPSDEDAAAPTPDLWLALVAGHSVWADGEHLPGPRERVASAFALGGVAACAALAWTGMRLQNRSWPWQAESAHDVWRVVAVAAVLAVAVGFGVYQARIVFGRPIKPAPFWRSVVWRGACFTALVVGLVACAPLGGIGAGVTVGLLAGADLMLSFWALGTVPAPTELVRKFLISPVHLGVVGAGVAVVVAGSGPSAWSEFAVYLAVLVALAATLLAMRVLGVLAAHFESQYEFHRAEVAATERARRAHWLHDDVLSEVRLASLRITAGSATPEQINAELLDLDHRLRLRQLDEMIRGATPPIYEVLQPHLRRAQSLGVRLGRVPTHEVTGVTIEEHEACLLNRVLSLLTSNAINAGATELSVELHLPDGALYVVVSDDAGGFDLASVPQGRGLHRLMTELGPDAVVRADTPDGSMMIVRMPRNGPAAGTPASDALARPTRQALA